MESIFSILFLFLCLLLDPVVTQNPPKLTVGVPLRNNGVQKGAMGNGKMLCVIHTAKPSHETRAKTVYDVWGKKCDDVLFFTDSLMDWNVPHIYFPNFTTRSHSWEKIRHVMKFLQETTLGQYDWYLRADDDAFVLVDNAKQFLKRYDPNLDHLFGYRWGFYETKGFADGSTYIMSWKTLESFGNVTNDVSLCPEFHRAEEDQELSRCLGKIGVYPSDSRDSSGRDRFHQFHPEEHTDKAKEQFIKTHAYYRYKSYPDNVSPTTVSMHHLSPYEMRFMDFLVNTVQISDD